MTSCDFKDMWEEVGPDISENASPKIFEDSKQNIIECLGQNIFEDLGQNIVEDVSFENTLFTVALGGAVDMIGTYSLHHLMRHESTTSGCLTVLRAFLSQKADVNERDEKKMTPLHYLFRNKNLWKDVDILNSLLSAGAVVSAADQDGETALHHLISHADTASDCLTILNALLTHKADINARNKLKRSALHLLCRNENLWTNAEILNTLISAGAHVNTVDKYGDTPLNILMRDATKTSDCLTVLHALLSHKVDVNVRNIWHQTSIHLLMQNKNLLKDANILSALLSTNVDVNRIDTDGDTPLHYLMRCADTSSDCLTILNLLLTNKAYVNAKNNWRRGPLSLLFINKDLWKNTDILNALLSAGAHVNAVDEYCDAPLHYLMRCADTTSDCLTVLNILLTHKADINARNEWEETHLHIMFQNENLWTSTDILNALLSAGARVNEVDVFGEVPLHYLMRCANRTSECILVLKDLLTHNADVNALSIQEMTPLYLLLGNTNLLQDTSILNALLSAGAHVNTADKEGQTPLHNLMKNARNISCCVNILHILLMHKVDINARDEYGRTPIYFLLQEPEVLEDVGILLVLIAEGADVNMALTDMETPLSTILCHKMNANNPKPWENILKLIIRCEILKFQNYFFTFESEEDLVSHFLMLDIIRKIYSEAWCYSYVKDCICELLRMKKHTFEGNFPLSKHLFHFFESGRQLKSFPSDIIDDVLDSIARGCYPCYEDIIKLLIHPHDFSDNLTLSVWSDDNTEELFLNSYCVSAIAKFLPKHDLINLRQAAYRANEKRKLEHF